MTLCARNHEEICYVQERYGDECPLCLSIARLAAVEEHAEELESKA